MAPQVTPERSAMRAAVVAASPSLAMQSTTAWITISRVRALRSAWVRRRERPLVGPVRVSSLRVIGLAAASPRGE
jgi:hypothetical protein